jgi:predicted Zn-dependent protease
MRKYIIAALLLVTAGIGVSFFLIPSQSDTDRAQARDQQAIVIGNVDVEAEYNQGRRSFVIVAALADKRVTEGNRPAAIALLEEYVKNNGNDARGNKKLAEQYQLAGRQADYNAQLVALAATEPTEANLRVLSDVYNADKNYPKQVEVLKKIVEVTNGENPKYFADLATIQLASGDKDGALKTIEDLKVRHPNYNDYSIIRIKVSILAEKGEADKAFAEAKAWIDAPRAALALPPAAPVPPSASPQAVVSAAPTPASREAQELADLCNILHYSGHADKAVALVEPHLGLIDSSTELAVAYVNASITAGRSEAAYALLTKIDAAGKMTPDLAVPYLQLALKRDDAAAAKKIVETVALQNFSEEQSLNLIETARGGNQPDVLATLLARFAPVDAVQGKPVLAAVVGILSNAADQDKRIETALNTQLTSLQRLRLAESCARASKKPCFDAILAQYPAVPQMTTPQIGEYAQLYIIANRPAEVIAPVGVEAAKPGAHPDVIWAHIRLAAASGNATILKPWLEDNAATTTVGRLQELFYLANDRRHGIVAADVADRLYARDPSPMNRDILVASYLGSNQPEKALPLLRESLKTPGADDANYLAALNKLARNDAKARKEMTDYAQAALQSNYGNDRAQLNYAYILLNNGKRPEALPLIKARASERGGEWQKLYAQLTRPATATGGKPAKALTREERIALAATPKISSANKRGIAFSLLKDGHKADATTIFTQLAANAAPDSQEVKDLLYLWGGKLNNEQMAWVQNRARTASPYDKQKWAEIINNYGDDRMVIDYVSATPDALYNENLRAKYFRSLAERGSKQDFDVSMRNWVAQTTDVPALSDYAATAQAFGYHDAAMNGYQRVVQLDPANAKGLSALSALTYSKGNYAQANHYTDRALSAAQSGAGGDRSVTHFYKAQLLKRQGKLAEAKAEYAAVVAAVQQSGNTATDALSRLYTAQFNLGQGDTAIAGFSELLAKNPDNKGILADFMSSLIEHRYYDEATRVANQYDKSSPYYGKTSALRGASAHVASVERLSNGREMRIGFNAPLEKSPFAANQFDQLAWVERSEVGYDSVTISAKPGVIVRFEPTAHDAFMVVPQAVEEISPQVENQRQQDLRLQLLYARIENETGQAERARQRLTVLQQYYPGDPQLLSYKAGVESAHGNRKEAVALLQQAQTYAPENEDIGQMLSDIQRAPVSYGRPMGQQFIKLDGEYRRYGKPREFITTLSGMAHAGNNNEIGFTLQNDTMDPRAILDPKTGLTTDKDKSFQAGELYLAHYFDNGVRVQGSLFGDGNTAGAGGYVAFNNPLGRTELLGEYHKYYWDYPEAVYDYANRDRIGLRHYATVGRVTTLGVETSLNNYNIEVGDEQAQTGLLRLSLVHQLQAQTATQPYFGVGYGFDGEYLFDTPESRTVNGLTYRPFSFRDREVHFLSGIYRDNWTPTTHALIVAGYAYDRLNEDGPSAEARITQDLTADWELGVRGRYGIESSAENSDAVNLGAHLKYKF